jgi:hypothetical protein
VGGGQTPVGDPALVEVGDGGEHLARHIGEAGLGPSERDLPAGKGHRRGLVFERIRSTRRRLERLGDERPHCFSRYERERLSGWLDRFLREDAQSEFWR